MKQTRREFLVTTGVGMCAFWGLAAAPSASTAVAGHGSRDLLQGDPYTSHVHDEGLGGRSFDAMREHALRFRSTPDDRDRYVLGLEV
jgi:hypothetical protein